MNNNPYKVLGVSESATQEEIRAAYLGLVKKYHPDKYIDSDLKEIANEKLMEVNEAYEQLTKKGAGSKANRTEGAGAYQRQGGYGSSYAGPHAAAFTRARSYISLNNLSAAKQVLDSIPTRNAEWYYLYGVIYLRQGWYDRAYEYLSRAYQQEPNNAEYSSAYQTIRSTGNPYTRTSAGYSANAGACNLCTGLLCADCCCECCSGGNCDIIPCC